MFSSDVSVESAEETEDETPSTSNQHVRQLPALIPIPSVEANNNEAPLDLSTIPRDNSRGDPSTSSGSRGRKSSATEIILKRL